MLLGKFIIFRCWPTVIEIWQPLGLSLKPQIFLNGRQMPLIQAIMNILVLLNSATNSVVFIIVKSAFETRCQHRYRKRRFEYMAHQANQVKLPFP